MCLLLLGASVVLHNDVRQLVLDPVEALINRAEAIRAEPMTAIQMAERETRKEDWSSRLHQNKAWGGHSSQAEVYPEPLCVCVSCVSLHDAPACA